jgi:hypothetical protein
LKLCPVGARNIAACLADFIFTAQHMQAGSDLGTCQGFTSLPKAAQAGFVTFAAGRRIQPNDKYLLIVYLYLTSPIGQHGSSESARHPQQQARVYYGLGTTRSVK